MFRAGCTTAAHISMEKRVNRAICRRIGSRSHRLDSTMDWLVCVSHKLQFSNMISNWNYLRSKIISANKWPPTDTGAFVDWWTNTGHTIQGWVCTSSLSFCAVIYFPLHTGDWINEEVNDMFAMCIRKNNLSVLVWVVHSGQCLHDVI